MQLPSDLIVALREFNLTGAPVPLPGGSASVYRSGDWVLKKIRATSLENQRSPELAAWIAAFSETCQQDGFRLPAQRKTRRGDWITEDGWIATHFLPGRTAEAADIPACIDAIQAMHHSLRSIPAHEAMRANPTAWGFAQAHCWGEKPVRLQTELSGLVNELYRLRQSVQTAPFQLIHGDLNPGNILIDPMLPPAFLDFSPFWGPPEFALAIFANFIGPRRGDRSVLRFFEEIPDFDQLLIRASVRMLLVVSALDGLEGWQESEEKWAAECVIAYVQGR